MFQSHNGAIATLVTASEIEEFGFVSIPQWCDCDPSHASRRRWQATLFQSHNGAIATGERHVGHKGGEGVSIPQWCDCDAVGREAAVAFMQVSIPQWCDCDTRKPTAVPTAPPGFNPTMVRLRQILSLLDLLSHADFNPTMVRLRHACLRPPTQSGAGISIPQWCDCDAQRDVLRQEA